MGFARLEFEKNDLQLLRQTQNDTDRISLETPRTSSLSESAPLLLIHPIGVGLSSRFWDRFIRCWRLHDPAAALLAPDLLGCGTAACPPRPLTPEDWAAPLITLLRERNSGPAVLVVQGASLPIALAMQEQAHSSSQPSFALPQAQYTTPSAHTANAYSTPCTCLTLSGSTP